MERPLTPRQREVAELVARGMSHKEISRQVGISLSTVKNHVYTAAAAIPGDRPPRYRLIFFILGLEEERS